MDFSIHFALLVDNTIKKEKRPFVKENVLSLISFSRTE